MKLGIRAFALLLALALAGPALAAKGAQNLTPTGNTIAGPGSASLDQGETLDMVEGLNGEEVCVTATNTGKEPIQLDLVDNETATSVEIPAGQTRTLCGKADAAGFTCSAEKGCTASWRVDQLQ